MNEILKTTKWAVIVTSLKDGEELQKLFPKDRAGRGDLKWLVRVGFESYDNLAVSPTYSGVYDGSDWHYSPIRFYQEKENCTVYTLEELTKLMAPKLKTKEELPIGYFLVENPQYLVYPPTDQNWKEYISWLNKEYNKEHDGSCMYYGVDSVNGTKFSNDTESFNNNPKVYSAKEFMDILKDTEIKYLEPDTYAIFKSNIDAKKIYNKAVSGGINYDKEFEFDGSVLAFTDEGVLRRLHTSGRKKISPEEFEERLLNTIQKLKPMQKKIIGYIAPYKINGAVPKGSIFEYTLGKSIVETWEALYEEPFKKGDWVTIVNPDPNFEGRFNIGDLYKVRELSRHNGKDSLGLEGTMYAVYFTEVRLATQEEINSLTDKVISMGNFDLKIKPSGIYHKSENITKFCEETFQFYKNLPTKFSGYDAIIQDITFKKTGCENKETKLSQWVNLYEEYLKIKA